MNTIVRTSSSEIRADLDRLFRDIKAGHVIQLADVGYTIAPTDTLLFVEDDDDEAADMASLRTATTGVDNTIFVSTKASGRHAARIKIAVDPPDSLNATSKTASMAIHDYGIVGAYVPPHVVEQAKRFIEFNRDVLLDYWDAKISTEDLLERLKKPEG